MHSWKTPTPDQADRVLPLTARPAEFRYFLERLKNPLWLHVFYDHRLFETPPEPLADEAAGTVHFPAWPLSEFLARIASESGDTELILAIGHQIARTKNVHVQRDLLTVVLVLPPKKSAEFTKYAQEWLVDWHSNIVDMLAVPLRSWMKYLAGGGQAKAAHGLARHVLALVKPEGEDPGRGVRDLVGRLSPFWYREFLKDIPILVRAAPRETLAMLLGILNASLRLSVEGPPIITASDSREDHSTIWRHDIAAGEPWSDRDYRQHLIDALLASAPILLEGADAGAIEDILRQIEKGHWVILQRMALHILTAAPFPESLDSTRSRLFDIGRLQDSSLLREYDRLLAERFKLLNNEEQGKLIGLIDHAYGQNEGPGAPGRADDYRKYRRLLVIADYLDASHSRELDDLRAVFGPVESFDELQVSGPITDVSPLEASQLAEMPITELVTFLKTWHPPKSVFERVSTGGLALQLEQEVQKSAQRFADMAQTFIDVPGRYQKALLQGLASALDGRWIPNWQPVLVLCETIAYRSEAEDDLKRTLLRLLGKGLSSGTSELTTPSRGAVWSIIRHLTRDQDPTPENERAFMSPLPDPITTSINSVRGIALESVMRYALWVSRSQGVGPGAVRSLELMHEVRDVLEERLDVSVERTIAVRSVYGRFLPQLMWLDAEWTQKRLEQIFPTDPELAELRDAAWESFLIATPAYSNVFNAARTQYEYAVRRLPTKGFDWGHVGDPLRALGRHLVTLYWRGDLHLEDHLMSGLFTGLDPESRRSVLAFCGQVLRGEDTVDPNILSRLQMLWDWRRSEIEAGRGDASELCAFSWWFVSKHFDDHWAIKQLTHALSVGKCEGIFEEEISARLAEARTVPAADIVDALEQVVNSDRWGVISIHPTSAMEILRRGLREGGQAREKAEQLTDKLSRLGQTGFSDLIRE